MSTDKDHAFRMRLATWAYYATSDLAHEHESHQEIITDIRHAERERCIAAMVASQDPGMRAVMEQRYREIMEAGK